jgi:phage tail-like protein
MDDLPLHVFRFHVSFSQQSLANPSGAAVALCQGAFSECTGLEATMEPKVIKVGGSNYGAVQRAGPVSFATVVLKRGISDTRDLWNWFAKVGAGAYAYRLQVEIEMRNSADDRWCAGRCAGRFRSNSRPPTSMPRAARSASRNCIWPTRAWCS